MQLNPALLGWFPFFEQSLDAIEVLFDSIMAPLDGPGLMLPGMEVMMREISSCFPLLGHSNYGGDFGFDDLINTPAVKRHVPLAKLFNVPWVSNHCFYSESSWCDVWSSPIQFSEAEAHRVAERARLLQEQYGVPLAHENAAYYRQCPGSTLSEEEFLARVVELSGTYIHLDLHNLYANERNFFTSGYSASRFLDTIPLDRVICIHMAGGRWIDDYYHDLHDTTVPEPLWDILDDLLARTHPNALIFEYETEALYGDDGSANSSKSIDLIVSDLERGRAAWDRAYGPNSRRTTKQEAMT